VPSVGQAVIQIAAHRGLKTINFVRNRANFTSLKSQLVGIGATHVLSYDELADKSVRGKVKTWTGGADIRLGLNCVSGPPTTQMAALLGQNAYLVSYGAMSKQPLCLPTSLFIFKNLHCRGFWQTRWYEEQSKTDREQLMNELATLMVAGTLKAPEHEIVTITSDKNDDSITEELKKIFGRILKGQYSKKVLLKFPDCN